MSSHQHSSSSMTGCDKNHRDNDQQSNKHESTNKSSSPKLQHLYEHSFHPPSSLAAAVALQQETSQESSSSDEPSLSSKINEQVISLFDGSVAAAYKKKPIIIQACTNCKKAHARCDEQKPCGRCVRLGKPDTCQIPVILKKRGRRKLTLDEKLERKKRRLISIDPIQQGQESETGEQEHEETHDHQLSSDHTLNDMRMMTGVDHPNINSYNNPNNNSNSSSIPYHYHPHHTLPSSTVSPLHLLNNNMSANGMMRTNSTTASSIPNSNVPPIVMNSIVQQQSQQPQSQTLLITNHLHTNSNNNHSSLGHTTPPSSLSHYHPVVNIRSIPTTTMAQSHPHSQLSQQQQQQQQSILSQLQSTSNSATVAQPYSMNNLQQQQQQSQVTMTPSTNITTNNSNSDSFYEQVKWLMDHQHLVQQQSMVLNNNQLQQPMGNMTNSSIASSCTAAATATPTPTNTPLTSNFFNALQQQPQQQQHSSTQPLYYDNNNNNNNTTNNHFSHMIQQNETPFVTCPYATLTTPSLPAYSLNSQSSNNIQTNIHMNKNETSDNDSNSNMSQASLTLHLKHLLNQQQQGQNHQDNLCSDTESDSAEALFQVLGSHRDNTSPTSATITKTTMTSHYQQTQGSANGRCNNNKNNSSSSSSSISSEDLSFDTITREDSGELFSNQEFSTVEQNLSDKELVKQLMAENRRLSEQLNCLRSVSTVLHDQIVSSCPHNNPESKRTPFDKERDHFVRDLLVHNSITYDKERSLSKIFRESTDRSGIVLSVASGQIVAVCPVVRRILGYPTQKAEREGFSRYDLRRSGSDDILLQVWRDVLHPTTFQSSLRIFAEAMAKRQGLLQLHAPMILRAGSESDTEPSYTLCKRFDSYIFYCQDMVPQSTPLIFYVLTRIFF